MGVGVGVDGVEDGGDGFVGFVWLGKVSVDGLVGDGESLAVKVGEEFVVEAGGV